MAHGGEELALGARGVEGAVAGGGELRVLLREAGEELADGGLSLLVGGDLLGAAALHAGGRCGGEHEQQGDVKGRVRGGEGGRKKRCRASLEAGEEGGAEEGPHGDRAEPEDVGREERNGREAPPGGGRGGAPRERTDDDGSHGDRERGVDGGHPEERDLPGARGARWPAAAGGAAGGQRGWTSAGPGAARPGGGGGRGRRSRGRRRGSPRPGGSGRRRAPGWPGSEPTRSTTRARCTPGEGARSPYRHAAWEALSRA